MDEFYSPNCTEYIYEKKVEGKARLIKYLLLFGYFTFVLGFFLICYATRLVPMFALCPLFAWILVYFTWHIVSYDVYYTFEHGNMVFGKIKKQKRKFVRIPCVRIKTQNALIVMRYKDAINTFEYSNVRRVHDFSLTFSSENLIAIVYKQDEFIEAVIFEGSKKLAKLLVKFSPKESGAFTLI